MDICERIYHNFFGINEGEFKKCEVPWCGMKFSHVHQISGADTCREVPAEDLIGLCEEHKTKYRKNKFWVPWLKVIHLHNIINHKKRKRLC